MEEAKGENSILMDRVKNLAYKIYLPFTKFYKIWIALLLGIFMYNLVLIPFDIAFQSSIRYEFIILDLLTICINIYDIKIRARTAQDKYVLL